MKIEENDNRPNDRGLYDVFSVLVHRLEHVRRFSLDFGLDRKIQVDADLLRLEVYRKLTTEQSMEVRDPRDLLGLRSYWSFSSLMRIFALTKSARI